jgi:apolipoprotein N-acyltransferase
MKHRKAFFRTIWVIAFGVILTIFSAFPWGDFSISWSSELSVSLEWAGAAVITLGVFALAITLIQEYLDREKENPSKS